MVDEAVAAEEVDDESEIADEALPGVIPSYDITSYGIDFDVDGLVRRFENGDVILPAWQRKFVWTPQQCARFIESLLLGLPVPGIFMYVEPGTRKLVVIDGQQRLKTIVAFYRDDLDGEHFRLPENGDTKYQHFHPAWEGKGIADLSEDDRRRLDTTIIHATVLRQDAPADDLTSVYHIFERINSTGTKLTAQEIRAAIYGGELDNFLQRLNADADWRFLYGPVSKRLKDQELILRFIALVTSEDDYARPMTDFLNAFMGKHQNLKDLDVEGVGERFTETMGTLRSTVGRRAFRPSTIINAAVFDAVAVGTARRLSQGSLQDTESFKDALERLFIDENFRSWTAKATSDDASVKGRIELATKAFADVK